MSPTQVRTELLVSIQNAAEAKVALNRGVPWIDLKNPELGALGAANQETCAEVASLLGNHPARSAALGELCELRWEVAKAMARHFPILKVGLSQASEDWKSRFLKLQNRLNATRPVQLVPVIYADWSNCGAPEPDAVLSLLDDLNPDVREHAEGESAQTVLLDTYSKDGRTLTDYCDLEALKILNRRIRAKGARLVLAGSLKHSQIPALLDIGASAIGVRSAVCSKDRSGPICPKLVEAMLRLFESHDSPSLIGQAAP